METIPLARLPQNPIKDCSLLKCKTFTIQKEQSRFSIKISNFNQNYYFTSNFDHCLFPSLHTAFLSDVYSPSFIQ